MSARRANTDRGYVTPIKDSRVLGSVSRRQKTPKQDNFEEVTIETNDSDVPLIIYYKPKVHREEQRKQAAVRITQTLRRLETCKYFQAINKLSLNVGGTQNYITKTQVMARLFEKITARRQSQTFTSLVVNKVKSKQSATGCKLIGAFASDFRLRQLRHAFTEVKTRGLHEKIKELSDGNILAKQLDAARLELGYYKSASFSAEFIGLSNKLQRLNNYESYFQALSDHKYKEQLVLEIKDFQQLRSKQKPRRNEPLQNESVAVVLDNVLTASSHLLSQYSSQISSLQEQLDGYRNAQGIQELKVIIQQKDKQLNHYQQFVNEITRLDTELQKWTGDKLNTEKLGLTISQQEKKMSSRLKSLDETLLKIAESRGYFCGVVTDLLQKEKQAREAVRSQYQSNITTVIQQVHDTSALSAFMRKKLKGTALIKLIQILLEYENSLSSFESRMEGQLSSKESELTQLREKLSNIQKNLKAKEDDLTSSRKQSRSAQKQLKDKEKELSSVKITINRLEERVSGFSDVQSQLAELRKSLRSKEQELNAANKKLHQLEGKLKDYNELRTQLTSANNRVHSLERTCQQLTDLKNKMIEELNKLIWLIEENTKRVNEHAELVYELQIGPHYEPLCLEIIKLFKFILQRPQAGKATPKKNIPKPKDDDELSKERLIAALAKVSESERSLTEKLLEAIRGDSRLDSSREEAMNARFEEYERRIKELTNENSKLSKQLFAANRATEDAKKAKNQEYQRRILELMEENSKLSKMAFDARKMAEDAKKIEEFQRRITELMAENTKLTKKISELNRLLSAERNKPQPEVLPPPLPDLEGATSGIRARVEEYEKRILDLVAENQRLSKTVFEANRAAEESKRFKIEEYERKILELIDENSRLSKRVFDVNRQIEEAKKSIIEEYERKLLQLMEENSTLSATASEARRAIEEVKRARFAQYEQKIHELIEENSRLAQDIFAANRALEEARRSPSTFQGTKSGVEAANRQKFDQYEQRIAELISENERLSKSIFHANRSAEQARKARIQEYERKILEMIEQNSKLSKRMFEVNRSIEEAKKVRIEEYEKKILEIMDENSRLSKQIFELTRQVEELKRIASQFEQRPPQVDPGLKAHLDESERRIIELIEENNHLSKSAFEANRLVEQLSQKIRVFEVRMQQLTHSNQALRDRWTHDRDETTSKLITDKLNQIYQQLERREHNTSRDETTRRQIEYIEEITVLRQQVETLREKGTAYERDQGSIINKLKQEVLLYQNKAGKAETELSSIQITLLELETKFKEASKMLQEQREANASLITQVTQFQSRLRGYDQMQNSLRDLQNVLKNLEAERIAIGNELHEVQRSNGQLHKYNEELKTELNKLKTDFFSVQLELHGQQTSRTHLTEKISQLQQELREKQTLIDNLLINSKEASSNLNIQVLQLREELSKQERKYESRLLERKTETDSVEKQISDRDGTIRNLQAEKVVLEQRIQSMTGRDKSGGDRDKEIQYLNEQIKSLQQFLHDITTQYRQLQYKYQQEKYSSHNRSFSLKHSRTVLTDRSGVTQKRETTERWKARQHALLEELNRLDTSADRLNRSREGEADLANQFRELLTNNQQLTSHLEQIRAEKQQMRVEKEDLLVRLQVTPQQEWVIELVFNLLLKMGGLTGQSPKGSELWNHLMSLNSEFKAEHLFMALQQYCSQVIEEFRATKRQ